MDDVVALQSVDSFVVLEIVLAHNTSVSAVVWLLKCRWCRVCKGPSVLALSFSEEKSVLILGKLRFLDGAMLEVMARVQVVSCDLRGQGSIWVYVEYRFPVCCETSAL